MSAINKILQGTNPEMVLSISTSDYSVADIVKLELVLINEGKVTIHNLGDVTLDTENNSIVYQLTEEETFGLSSKAYLYVRTRVLLSNGRLIGTEKESITVEENESKERMTS